MFPMFVVDTGLMRTKLSRAHGHDKLDALYNNGALTNELIRV